MYYIWITYAIIGMITWFWSAVFHARDFKTTELLDYLFSDLFVCYK